LIPLLTRQEARAIDADASDRLGLPTLLLMENAGRSVYELLCAEFADLLARVVIVAGPGQNGGDGFVVARHLWSAGHCPRVVLLGDPAQLRGDALINYRVLERLDVPRTCLPGADLAPLVAALAEATLVLDALFGTGLTRALEGRHAEAVLRINASPAKIIALDLPSGVDADTGAVLGTAVQADLTATFAAHKRGLHQYPGAGLAGDVRLASIGVSEPFDAGAQLIEPSDVARWLPARAADAHKGVAGHVLIVAGSPGKTGAAALCGLGALRAGAGLVTLAARGAARAALDAKVVELMTAELPLEEGPAFTAAESLAEGMDAAVVGPGLGLDQDGRALARRLALGLALPTVLDADALTAFGIELAALRGAAGPRVLTPHPGEAARLLGTSSKEVQADRYAAAQRLAETSRCVVVLKGAGTIVAEPQGRMRVSRAGTPAMAVGGTGDVLGGCVAALLPHADAFDAASAAVELHGRAGTLAATGDRGLLASELANHLPRALLQCRAAFSA
jgi:NAD(P)H-hydrate epimerase